MSDDLIRPPRIVLVGIGGGGSRILSEGITKFQQYKQLDRYRSILEATGAFTDRPHWFLVDTSVDPLQPGFYPGIPKENRVSLSKSVEGVSRGAGGKPGRAADAMRSEAVAKILCEELYRPLRDLSPSVVVLLHSADGGTGGGLTPELVLQLGYALPSSTVFWVFSVLPIQSELALSGPRTVGCALGRLLQVARNLSDERFDEIPFVCREAIDKLQGHRSTDGGYDFEHSRVALFPLSNNHFAQCWADRKEVEIRKELLNPFPLEILGATLHPYLRYHYSDPEEQAWMQENWPLGPVDIPDIMAGISKDRPFVVPHVWFDPADWSDAAIAATVTAAAEGRIAYVKEDFDATGRFRPFDFTGAATGFEEFGASRVYCLPVYPKGSPLFEEMDDLVSNRWFPQLASRLKYFPPNESRGVGAVTHAANLKPQPFPASTEEHQLDFDRGFLVSLLFGAVPSDFRVWIRATEPILAKHDTEPMWEITAADSFKMLQDLAKYAWMKDWSPWG